MQGTLFCPPDTSYAKANNVLQKVMHILRSYMATNPEILSISGGKVVTQCHHRRSVESDKSNVLKAILLNTKLQPVKPAVASVDPICLSYDSKEEIYMMTLIRQGTEQHAFATDGSEAAKNVIANLLEAYGTGEKFVLSEHMSANSSQTLYRLRDFDPRQLERMSKYLNSVYFDEFGYPCCKSKMATIIRFFPDGYELKVKRL